MQNKVNQNILGLNLDAVSWQIKENQVTWALNANVQSFDGNSLTYTNEPSNTSCVDFTTGALQGFQIVGVLNIVEQNKVVLFLTHPDGRSRIGQITGISDSCQDVVLSEHDCGCQEGTVITKAEVVDVLPKAEIVPTCPDGYYYDSDAEICRRTQYAIPQITKETFNLSPVVTNNAFGFMQPVLYDEGWNIKGWGGNGSHNNGITRLTGNWWKYVVSPLNPGRVNAIGVYISSGGVINTWLSFMTTICVAQEKIYYLAISADNAFRVKLNGTIILDPTDSVTVNSPTLDDAWQVNVFGSSGAVNADKISYGILHIYPLRLTVGSHIFQIEYVDYGVAQMVAAEIYDNSYAEILAATSIADLDVVWSTGNQTQVESITSIVCPQGYLLSTDSSCELSCVLQLETAATLVESQGSCCKYEDIKVDDCLDRCANSCYEYVVTFIPNNKTVVIAGVTVVIPDPLITIEKGFQYIDCLGNVKEDFILGTNKRFTAQKGSLDLNHPRLIVLQETQVLDPGTPSFSKENCCLGFDIRFPINAEYKIDNCGTKIYYIAKNINPAWLSIEEPYGKDGCGNTRDCIIDSCEDSKIFPNFCQPKIDVTAINSGGQLKAGSYSLTMAYAEEDGTERTNYFDFCNPVSVFERQITEQTEYVTSKSIEAKIKHKTKIFEYFNLVVAETINTVTNYYLVGTYEVNRFSDENNVTYTGDYKNPMSAPAVFVRSFYYENAGIIEKQNDILMIADLEEAPKYNFQPFASRLKLFWETVEMPVGNGFDYSNPEIASFFRTYQRDEVYPIGIQFELINGRVTDTFHIPGTVPDSNDLQLEASVTNKDVFVAESDCLIPDQSARWEVYNTAGRGGSVDKDPELASDIEKQYNCAIFNHLRGRMAYWESEETYPCNDEVWEQSLDPNKPHYNADALGGKPIRHHKFPDSAITHIHGNQRSAGQGLDTQIGNDSNSTLYPIGIRLDEVLLVQMLNEKDINGDYRYTVYDPIKKRDVPIKDLVCGYRISRGNRVGNKSVLAKGLLYDVGTLVDTSGDGQARRYYYPNYPYNDLSTDPFIRTHSKWYDDSRGPRLGALGIHIGDQDLGDDIVPRLNGFGTYATQGGNDRFTFHSPDTSFQYPKIGTELKLETLEFGKVLGHFIPVLEHPRYRFLDKGTYYDAGYLGGILAVEGSGETEVDGSVTAGVRNNSRINIRYDQMLVNEQIILDVVEKLVPFVNFAHQYTSIANYNQYIAIDPQHVSSHYGNSRRFLDLAQYASEHVLQILDDAPLHNRMRETSVYLKSRDVFPLHENQIQDNSRYLASDHRGNPQNLNEDKQTRALYASLKRQFKTQYGNIDSVKYVYTGYRQDIITSVDGSAELEFKYYPAFGGDTFITPFALKRKHSFFTRNLAGLPAKADEVPFDYWLFPNLGYPTFFMGTSNETSGIGATDVLTSAALIGVGITGIVALGSLTGAAAIAAGIISNTAILTGINTLWSKFVKKTALDKNEMHRYYKDGMFYTGSYGIPIFFVESDVNTHFRHGRDPDKENFYPAVGSGVPDDWLQEYRVPIGIDNFYNYNASYSMQNLSASNPYTLRFPSLECLIQHENRAIYSEEAKNYSLSSDKWLVFKPGNFYDFPKQGGKLIDLSAGDDNKVYARFVNTTKIYNAVIALSNDSPFTLEFGSASMFKQAPQDLVVTDLGYIGSQHKAYVRCEYGIFWVDAERGHIYKITSKGFDEIKSELNYNWFKENLPFQILKDFPEADIDNPAMGIGIMMGYDARFERVFITKRDYRVKPEYRQGLNKVEYVTDVLDPDYKYYVISVSGVRTRIVLGDSKYFENKSWTTAYSPKLENFISFYSFLPNYYIPHIGHFQTVMNTSTGASLWNHLLSSFTYQTFYGKLYPYILEYMVSTVPQTAAVTAVLLIMDIQEYYTNTEYYSLGTANNKNIANFNKAIIYNREQSSGIVELIPEIFGNTRQKLMYPRMTPTGIQTLLARADNKFTFNGFWNLAAQANGQPLWTDKWADIGNDYFIDKIPNAKAIRNLSISFQKNKIKSDFTKVRLIQDKFNRYKFINHFQISQTTLPTPSPKSK